MNTTLQKRILTALLINSLSMLSAQAQDCLLGTSQENLEVNNVRATMLNAGDMFWDQGGSGNAKYEIPKNSKKHSLFASALWVGGMDSSGNILVSSETYRQKSSGLGAYLPGPIVDSVSLISTQSDCLEWDRHFEVKKSTIEEFISNYNAGLIQTESDVPDEILHWPGRLNPYMNDIISNLDYWELAPFIDTDGDLIYDPLNGDYPDIIGHQSIWWVMNDVGGNKPYNGEPIGLEVHVEAFSFQSDDALNDATFQKYEIFNKGTKTLYNAYVGIWVDVDLGYYMDDYIQCDVMRGMGIGYNADNFDNNTGYDTIKSSQGGLEASLCPYYTVEDTITDIVNIDQLITNDQDFYGYDIPAIGVDFVKGVLADTNDGIDNDFDGQIDEDGEEIMMSNFYTYQNCHDSTDFIGNPYRLEDYYYMLQTKHPNGTPAYNDNKFGLDSNFAPTKYMFPGSSDTLGLGLGGTVQNPIQDSSNLTWSEESAGMPKGDRRFVMSMGPFTIKPGQKKEFVVAFPWAQSSVNNLDAIKKLKEADDLIQTACNNGFKDYPYIASIEEKFRVSLGKVFPTVTTDVVTIDLKRKDVKTNIELYNATGKLVDQFSIYGTKKISLQEQPKGIYILKIRQGSRRQTIKISKR